MKHCILSLAVLLAGLTASAAEPDRRGLDFFEAKIRPMLVTHCYECHSAGAAAKNKLEGGLLLDTRDGIRRGGESGPAVVPGQLDESLLISALKHEAFEMPPKGKLPDEIIAHFTKWIEMGAPDSRDGVAIRAASENDLTAGRQHWAFRPLSRPSPPSVEDSQWCLTPIDQFIRSRQETAGVEPNPLANARTLVRRAYFDLLGLPPSPEKIEEFVQDASNGLVATYEKLIDELLQSRHFGERWARHWLDITRFAESNGYAFDGDRPNAWHYRDFVIRALNSDMPYSQFVRLQIAGDLMTNVNVGTTAEATDAVDSIAATGFLVAGPYTTQQTQKERERSRYEQLDDIVNTLGTSLLGLTVGCSRCHDHKFDPLSQFDYYRMASCFAEVGFSDTAINMQPVVFQKEKTAHDAAHAVLVAKRTQDEQKRLPGRFEEWMAAGSWEVATPVAKLTFHAWHYLGPFTGTNYRPAYRKVFEPEEEVDLGRTYQDETLRWMVQPDWKDGIVHNTFSGNDTTHYVFRVIESAEDQIIRLNIGSGDAIKVWLNDREVLAHLVGREAAPDQEVVQVPIQKGRNTLLMKIVNDVGSSGFYFTGAALKQQELSTWYHIGPFTAKDYPAAFDESFPPELDTDLAKSWQDGKLEWHEQPVWHDGQVHNEKFTGNNCANYLLRVIESPRPQMLSLSLGSNGGIKLWVNGRETLANKTRREMAAASQEVVSIQLAAGRNELLMKIVNREETTGFYFLAGLGSTPAEMEQILASQSEKWTDEKKQKVIDWYKGFDSEWLLLNQVVVRSESQHPKPDLTEVFAARVRGETYQFGDDTFKVYHLRRGNADNKQDEAQPGFLKVLMRSTREEQRWLENSRDAEKPHPGRVALAEWLTDVDHGAGHLLARVMVNRLWQHHFGRGIVTTPSDFGAQGDQPTHPELLDWLASELISGDWKLKRIHKLIMTSGVYMQSGRVTASGHQHDPEVLLLWKRHARRLEAEIIRDALLEVSGTLDRTMFGPGTLDPKSMRRSVYFTVKRSQLIQMLQLFDAPDTMQGIGARQQSTVAPQALALLNSPGVREFATTFAARVRPDSEVSIEESIDRVYQVALARPATGTERSALKEFIQQQQSLRGGNAHAGDLAMRDFCHLVLCMNEFIYID